MRRKLVVYFLSCIALQSKAQLSVTLQVPPAGVVLKSQLWNIALVYTGNNTLHVTIKLTITDVNTGQPVITAATRSVLLSQGARQVRASDISPVLYQYPSPLVTDRNPDGFLPAGSYQACYTIVPNDKGSIAPLAEDCTLFEVTPLSPPLLNNPANGDTLLTGTPEFSWLPPAPLNLFGNLQYRVSIVPVNAGQSPADAMEQNLPVFSDDHLNSTFLNYPPSGVTLDTAKQYAWQVIAMNNRQPVGQSEVWAFNIAGPSFQAENDHDNFIVLDNAGANRQVYEVRNANIGIRYHSYDKASEDEIMFFSWDHQLIKTVKRGINYGDNYLLITLNKSFQKGQLYYVQITSASNRKYSAAFIVK